MKTDKRKRSVIVIWTQKMHIKRVACVLVTILVYSDCMVHAFAKSTTQNDFSELKYYTNRGGFVIYYTSRIILSKDTCVNAAISRCRNNEDRHLSDIQQISSTTEQVNHTLAIIHFTGLPAPRSLTVTTKENYSPS
ncbi:hypothetical protein B566_EDAN013125 [Ephemera danica]|nr:hypothetical protein B566_EDAN013125 [Ephemera danica]